MMNENSRIISAVGIFLAFLYIVAAPIVLAILAWYYLHWLLAAFGILLLPLFLSETLWKQRVELQYAASFHHPGGLIGGVLAIGIMQKTFHAGFPTLGVVCLLFLFPLLVVLFSVVSDAAVYFVKRWRWKRVTSPFVRESDT